jgi:methylisocitrate lyase
VTRGRHPVVADIDTGYGNAINVMRTVREFEAGMPRR